MTLHVVELPFRAISKRPERAKFVKLLFTNWVSTWLRNRIKYVPRSSHTNPLGTFEFFAQKPVKGVAFAVGDDSGDFDLSELAGRHWLELALASIPARRTDFAHWCTMFGYELGATGDAKRLLAKRAIPFVDVTYDGKPWLVAAKSATKIISDTDVGPPSFADLDAKGKAAVARVAKRKVCECFLCARLRKKP